MSFVFKINYQPHYAEETKYSFSKYVLNKGYCPIHPDVLIKKGFLKIQRNECWRCVQKYNQSSELIDSNKNNPQTIEQEVEKETSSEIIEILGNKYGDEVTNEENKCITEATNEYKKIHNILFRFHYEIQDDTSHCYKTFKCKLCKNETITRDHFKIVRLGHQNQCGPKHIKNIMPACLKCHSNWSIKHNFKKRFCNHLSIDIRNRANYVDKFNLVSLDEISFIHNYDIDQLFPIV
jgi:hypothetical protein